MNLCLVVVDAGCIPVILDDVHNELRHGIQSKERIVVIPCRHALNVTVDTRLGTDSEEKG